MGGVAIEVGDVAMLGNWMSWIMWGVSVGKPVMGGLKRGMR